jgi:hypothetical protein
MQIYKLTRLANERFYNYSEFPNITLEVKIHFLDVPATVK